MYCGEWTKEETEILASNYVKMSMDTLLEMLPGRSASAIIHKARRMEIRVYNTHRDWERMLKEYPRETTRWYALRMGVSKSTARHHIKRIRNDEEKIR